MYSCTILFTFILYVNAFFKHKIGLKLKQNINKIPIFLINYNLNNKVFNDYDKENNKMIMNNVTSINNKPFTYFDYSISLEQITWDEGEIPWDIDNNV